jgi:putative PEP-CTERM system integral membrane protein
VSQLPKIKRFASPFLKNPTPLFSKLVFWVWNLGFIGIMYLWLLPQFGFAIWRDTRSGLIEPTFTLSFGALLIVPLICTVLGYVRLRQHPILLMRLFYGVEAPLFTLCLVRLFIIRELTAASGFALSLWLVAILMFGLELLAGYSAYRDRLAWVQMISHSVILLVGLYTAALLLLYTLPAMTIALVACVVGFFKFGWVAGIGNLLLGAVDLLTTDPVEFFRRLLFSLEGLFIGLPLGLLFIFSFCVFVSMPYALVNFYVMAWARIRAAFGAQHGQLKSWAITGTTVALSCLLFIGLQATQPQAKAFELLSVEQAALEAAAEPAVESAAEQSASAQATSSVTATPEQLLRSRQQQLKNTAAIRAGLTNAYLYRYRYISPWSHSNRIKLTYRNTFDLGDSGTRFLQNIHNGLISPFLYRGEANDVEEAAALYEQFFDEPIQKAERVAIRKALQATANRDEASAGVLNLDEKIVRLASQAVSVSERGDWATVEIHEQYENVTNSDQEIFYSFSLPESAAITGLWLGDDENPQRFPFVVSPRGAAQQVYKAEVERAQFQPATDPALLEQVGPRQYRLRVFPIPASRFDERDRAKRIPGELHLKMTYQTMQHNGGWPLPQLSEKRNIYWTNKTEHTRGQRRIKLSEETWFEAALPAKKASAAAHSVSLAEGYQVTATPLVQIQNLLPTGKRLAIIVDSSYSMAQHKEALKQAANQLKSVAQNNQLDFYMSATKTPIKTPQQAAISVEPSAKDLTDIDNMMFYGSLQPADMLQQFASRRGANAYDAVLLITDEGSYELAKDKATLPAINAPLWIVHLDGKVPTAYEDGLLQLLQASGGGVETEVTAALQRFALAAQSVSALDGYRWTVQTLSADGLAANPDAPDSPNVPDSIEAITARQLIKQQSRTLDATQVSALDGVHAIAKRTGIVTPYSSMLVLVDERQRELLRAAEAGEDRFEREVEDGQNDLTDPDNPLTASIPEPSQVLALGVVAIALIFLKRKSDRPAI